MKEIDKLHKWLSENCRRDYTGKNIVITGSNSGIGFYLAAILASKGAHVIMPVRNIGRGEEAKRKILESYPDADITLMNLNLASFRSIKAFADEIISNHVDIDIFINNAGVFHMPKSVTEEGMELTVGTNFIGVKYLNDLLKDYFLSLNHQVEVLFTTSVAAYRARIDYDDFFLEKHYNKVRAYNNSKRCIIHYFLAYSEQVKDTNIRTYLTHPGVAYSPLIRKAYPGFFGFLAMVGMKILFHRPPKACLSMLMALEKEKNNAFYGPRGLLEASGYPKELKIRKRLYEDKDRTIGLSSKIIKEKESTDA